MDAVRETYYETVATRSIQKNSAKHKANGAAVTKLGNKPVTTTEILDKHGPIITYPSTDNFMTYPDFVRLPNDLKVEFVNKMMDRYDISLKYVSRHLFNKGDDGLRAMLEKWRLLKLVDMKKKRGDTDDNIKRFREEAFDWQERTRKAKEMDRMQAKIRQKACPNLITYAEFKKLTPEQQADFINRVIKYYQVTAKMIAEEVFEIRGTSLYNHFQRAGITKKIENLPSKISRNKEIMHENELNFKRFVSAWKDFSDRDDEKKEEKVIDIQSICKEKTKENDLPIKDRLCSAMAGSQKMPDDSEFELNDLPSVNKPSITVTEAPEPLCILNLMPEQEEERIEPVVEPDSMEYHQMHFSTNYISSEINMDEIYAIAAFFKRSKRVKVSIDISEV